MAGKGCPGFMWSGVAAGIKKNGQKDLGLICSSSPASAAAVFTNNRVKAAPVLLDIERIKSGTCQAVIVNSGNANCCNGEQGIADARAMAAGAAEALQIDEELVLVASTGVIGQPLPMDVIIRAIPDAARKLSANGLDDFSASIMTTDRTAKVVGGTAAMADGSEFTITAAAKGAGMIRPDMATMLCFVCTDARADAGVLQECLAGAIDGSFNRITVDGDTSTNDTVILMASGVSAVRVESDAAKQVFQDNLGAVLRHLAKMMVKDGEGATKVIDVVITGAKSVTDARLAAETVAHSPLVKTAFFGEDANWGRIMGAIGRSGADFQPDAVDIYFDDVQLVAGGMFAGGDAEARAAKVLKNEEIRLLVDLNTGGDGAASLLTCDLSLDYVKINADYRS